MSAILSYPSPARANDRIISLDALRGFAVLGILIMNIQSFSMISNAYVNPMAFGDFHATNQWFWKLSHIFASQKFMPIFAMLFGAGIVLMNERLALKEISSTALHYRRMMWLMMIGLMHAYLLWYGDILFTYALCGLLVFLFRKMSPAKLLFIGFLFFSMASIIYLFLGQSIPYWPSEQLEQSVQSWQPSAAAIQTEIENYRGSWIQQMDSRILTALFVQSTMFFMKVGWKTIGLMLVGMALYKWGIFSASVSKKSYILGAIAGFAIGLPIIIIGIKQNFEAHFSFEYSMFFGSQFNYWGSLFISYAYICLIMILFKSNRFLKVKKSFAAVGRMALSNYLFQTIICTFIFYGYGFGLFGKTNRLEQLVIVIAIWVFQIIVSNIYLKYFRYGPFEWLWRSLSYFKMQTLKK